MSIFGTYVTAQALQLLALLTLGASSFELGVLRAAQWLPYLLFGLVAGVLIDRYRRKPVVVGADFIRAAVLALIPLAAAVEVLTMPLLVGLVLVFGAVSLAYDVAHQSLLPNLVPPPLLTRANARLEQSAAVAQVGGQVGAGLLIKLLGAPAAILIDAVSYLISGVVITRLRVAERAIPAQPPPRDMGSELREGLRWVYRHRMLAPLSWATHAWFLCTSMVATIYVVFVVSDLGFDAAMYGLTLAVGGVGAVVGSSIAVGLGTRLGIGKAIILGRWLAVVGYASIPLAHSGAGGALVLCAGQFVFWLSVGIDSPLEMAYGQSVTPDRLMGRMRATIRSMNRAALVIGAPLGGALALWCGQRPTLWIAVAGIAAAALGLTGSQFRHARLEESSSNR